MFGRFTLPARPLLCTATAHHYFFVTTTAAWRNCCLPRLPLLRFRASHTSCCTSTASSGASLLPPGLYRLRYYCTTVLYLWNLHTASCIYRFPAVPAPYLLPRVFREMEGWCRCACRFTACTSRTLLCLPLHLSLPHRASHCTPGFLLGPGLPPGYTASLLVSVFAPPGSHHLPTVTVFCGRLRFLTSGTLAPFPFTRILYHFSRSSFLPAPCRTLPAPLPRSCLLTAYHLSHSADTILTGTDGIFDFTAHWVPFLDFLPGSAGGGWGGATRVLPAPPPGGRATVHVVLHGYRLSYYCLHLPLTSVGALGGSLLLLHIDTGCHFHTTCSASPPHLPHLCRACCLHLPPLR